jgi:hypothetical protein
MKKSFSFMNQVVKSVSAHFNLLQKNSWGTHYPKLPNPQQIAFKSSVFKKSWRDHWRHIPCYEFMTSWMECFQKWIHDLKASWKLFGHGLLRFLSLGSGVIRVFYSPKILMWSENVYKCILYRRVFIFEENS